MQKELDRTIWSGRVLDMEERNTTNEDKMKTTKAEDATRERMLRELMMALSHQVEAGDITDMQANEWYSAKADQWSQGLG